MLYLIYIYIHTHILSRNRFPVRKWYRVPDSIVRLMLQPRHFCREASASYVFGPVRTPTLWVCSLLAGFDRGCCCLHGKQRCQLIC